MTHDGGRERAPGRGKIYDSITETIGDTPLVAMDRIAKEKGVEARLLAKLEFFNPIGSVKDRIGVAMIDALEAQGKITPGRGDSGRADLRQYRHRARLRRRGARLQADPGDAGIDVDRAAQDAGSAGRGTGADAGRAGHEGRDRQGARNRRRDAGRGHAAAVRKSRQSGNPSSHHRRGNLERHRRRGRHRRLGRRHRRHDHRRRPGAEARGSRACG